MPPPVPHGGPDHDELERLGIDPSELLDFSVNSNPLGPSPRALAAITAVDPSRYPDRRASRLRRALAAAHTVQPEAVLVGNGSIELLWLLAQVYLGPGDRAIVLGPTFGEYEAAVRAAGAEPILVRADPADHFRPPIDETLAAIRVRRPRVLFVCNPNNPTGQALELGQLVALLAAGEEMLLVVDEAYIDFADGVATALALRDDPRVVVVRSLTKGFGLAGLRLGYLVANPLVAEAVGRAQPAWSVNALAQAAGLTALADRKHLEAGRQTDRRARKYLMPRLDRLGWRCVPTRANFWLAQVGDAAEVRHRLLGERILVRDCASFGLPDYIRLASRPLDECRRLLAAVAGLL